jgi:hypothetical protein
MGFGSGQIFIDSFTQQVLMENVSSLETSLTNSPASLGT